MKDGAALAIRMDRLLQASQALDAALHWSAQAEVVDSCGPDTPFEERPSLEQVMRPYCAFKKGQNPDRQAPHFMSSSKENK